MTVVTDGASTAPLSDLYVRNAAKADVSAALVGLHATPDKVTNLYNPIVVNTGSQLIAIDTGAGPGAFKQSKGSLGQFHNNFAAAGFDKKLVDVVILSHLHGDHISGLLDAESKIEFPNAEILMPAADIKFWTDESNATRFPDPVKAQFANVKRVLGALGSKVTQYEGSKEAGTRHHLNAHARPYAWSHIVNDLFGFRSEFAHQVDVTAGMGTNCSTQSKLVFLFDVDGTLESRRGISSMTW